MGRRVSLLGGFQFTHPCGCDCTAPQAYRHPRCFNSRTRVGATAEQSAALKIAVGFNSRTRVGATELGALVFVRCNVSIHAPVWVRPALTSASTLSPGFNSRTRVGATGVPSGWTFSGTVSIHAPVWVRPRYFRRSKMSRTFQFTHPCGCDNAKKRVKNTLQRVSIHAPVWVRLQIM